MSTAIAQGSFLRRAGKEYVVSCDLLELPRGQRLLLLPGGAAVGDLCLFDFSGSLLAGRWYMTWIQLPGIRIEFGARRFEILGRVVPVEIEIEPVSNLSGSEWDRLFDNQFPRWLDS